mgnify:CR=1 FL=1
MIHLPETAQIFEHVQKVHYNLIDCKITMNDTKIAISKTLKKKAFLLSNRHYGIYHALKRRYDLKNPKKPTISRLCMIFFFEANAIIFSNNL